ncbi:hypothetical protein B0O80DRAFT_421024 [Mortierella sp. GBAus27b]|nr:hypothetical protein BGX31_001256 [Mortierella sp. GBA43]KAI8363259.1 hypothetical protein B0O80DRAFT_421024 [Mortierella sp. GBAus27b]
MPLHHIGAFANTSNAILVTQIATISSIGIFAGTALNYNTIIMPSLRNFSASSSLSVWAEMFKRAYPTQISMIIFSAVSGSGLFYKTRNPYYLAGAAMMILNLPYTFTLMMPINNELLNIRKQGSGGDTSRVEPLLNSWETRHFGRTVLGFGALAVTLFAALRGSTLEA